MAVAVVPLPAASSRARSRRAKFSPLYHTRTISELERSSTLYRPVKKPCACDDHANSGNCCCTYHSFPSTEAEMHPGHGGSPGLMCARLKLGLPAAKGTSPC